MTKSNYLSLVTQRNFSTVVIIHRIVSLINYTETFNQTKENRKLPPSTQFFLQTLPVKSLSN